MLLSGILSAILVNDVVCVALTPLVLHLTHRFRLDPRPHLIGLAVASNLGSAATLTGNPQNMIIGGLSGISYLRFAVRLAPPALIGLVIGFIVTLVAYRVTLTSKTAMQPNAESNNTDHRVPGGPRHTALLLKSLFVTVAAVVLFFAGLPMAVVALGAAAILLLDRVNPAKVYAHIDWSLLLMFAGLFVVVAHVRGACPLRNQGGRVGRRGRSGLGVVGAIGDTVKYCFKRTSRIALQAGCGSNAAGIA